MKKLRMKLDALTVESFTPQGDPVKQSGTVQGHLMDSSTCPDGSSGSGAPDFTAYEGCWATGYYTCYGSSASAPCGC